MSWIVTSLWLIPAVPFAASLIILSLANSRRSAAAALAIIGQIAALALSILAFLPTLQAPGYRSVHNFTWFTFGEQALRIGWVLDPPAAAMLVMIALVGHCFFTMAEKVASSPLDCLRLVRAVRSSRCSFFAARSASRGSFHCTFGCRTQWKVQRRSVR